MDKKYLADDVTYIGKTDVSSEPLTRILLFWLADGALTDRGSNVEQHSADGQLCLAGASHAGRHQRAPRDAIILLHCSHGVIAHADLVAHLGRIKKDLQSGKKKENISKHL